MNEFISTKVNVDVPDGRRLVVMDTAESVCLFFDDQPERVLELPFEKARELQGAIHGLLPDSGVEAGRCRSPNGMKARR